MPQQLLRVRNHLSEVGRVNETLREFWVQQALPEDFEMPVTLALEEVLSNVIRHGCIPGREYDIQVCFIADRQGIRVEVSDDAAPFDPLSLPPPDLNVPIGERKPGGLGVHLLRRLMEEVTYARRDGRNLLAFSKRWA